MSDDEWLNELCRRRRPTDANRDEDQSWLHELCRSRSPAHSSALDANWLQTLSVMSVAPAASGTSSSREPVDVPTKSVSVATSGASSSREPVDVPTTSVPPLERLTTPIDGSIVWEHLFHGKFTFALPHGLRMRQACDHCSLHIHRRLASMGLAIFKLGVAADPEHRFNNLSFGYKHDGYMFMDVLWRGAPRDCVFLEDELIKDLRTKRGCQNQNRGGGGVDPNNTCYQSHVYVVFAPCGDGVGIMAAARKRRRLTPT